MSWALWLFLMAGVLAVPPAPADPPPPPVVIEVPVEVPVYVEVYNQPRKFSGLPELREWLWDWQYIYIMENGSLDFTGHDEANDCDDQAIQMVEDMARDGFIAGVALDDSRAHLLVTVIIGKWFYFVEPSTKEIFFDINGRQWVTD